MQMKVRKGRSSLLPSPSFNRSVWFGSVWFNGSVRFDHSSPLLICKGRISQMKLGLLQSTLPAPLTQWTSSGRQTKISSPQNKTCICMCVRACGNMARFGRSHLWTTSLWNWTSLRERDSIEPWSTPYLVWFSSMQSHLFGTKANK